VDVGVSSYVLFRERNREREGVDYLAAPILAVAGLHSAAVTAKKQQGVQKLLVTNASSPGKYTK
jgi:hypothetical protein